MAKTQAGFQTNKDNSISILLVLKDTVCTFSWDRILLEGNTPKESIPESNR